MTQFLQTDFFPFSWKVLNPNLCQIKHKTYVKNFPWVRLKILKIEVNIEEYQVL